MLKGYSLLTYSLWVFQFVSSEEIFVPSSSILSVSLNSREVEVNRTFDVNDVGAGYHTLVLSHLPKNIDESSISVEGRGPADLLSTTRVERIFERFDNPEYIKLKQQLETLRESLIGKTSILNREVKMNQQRVATTKKFVDITLQPKKSIEKEETYVFPVDKLVELLDVQDREISAADAKIGALEHAIKTYEDSTKALDTALKSLEHMGQYKPLINMLPAAIAEEYSQQLLQLPDEAITWSHTKAEKDLHINIYVDAVSLSAGYDKVNLTFYVTYMSSSAAWSADYDVKIDKTPAKITSSAAAGSATAMAAKHSFDLKIAFYAAVEQDTGENWEDVQLELSTADPSDVGYSPQPHRQKVSFLKPRIQEEYANEKRSSGGRFILTEGMSTRQPSSVPSSMPSSSEYTTSTSAFASAAAGGERSFKREKAQLSKSADLGATYAFAPKHKVTVKSNTIGDNVAFTGMKTSSKTRLFISEMSLNPLIYSYIVPTRTNERAFLKSWGQFNTAGDNCGAECTAVEEEEYSVAPLLHSDEARIFLQGSYAGTTEVPSTQPGATLRLNLGEDKKLTFKSVFVPPRENSKEEESGKTQWFVTAEKEKFRVKHTEYAFSLLNTHESDHLVIMSEYLPHAVEDAIRVELVQPNPAQVIHLKRDNADSSGSSESSSDVWSEEEFIDAVLAHPVLLQHPMHPLHEDKKATHIRATKQQQEEEERMKSMIGGEENLNRQFVFVSKGSSNVVWAQWVKPGQSVISSLQYRVIWPDGKEISTTN